MRKLILLLLCAAAWAQGGNTIAPGTTIAPKTTLVRPTGTGGATVTLVGTPSQYHCTGGGTTCLFTPNQNVTAGHAMVFLGDSASAGVPMSSISQGGTLVAGSTSGLNSTGCSTTVAGHGLTGTHCGWVLSSSGTSGSITITFAFSDTSFSGVMAEYACSGGTVSHDVDGNVDSATNTTPFAGVGLTLTGTNDFVLQYADGAVNDPTSITTYSGFIGTTHGPGWANLLNTTSGTAPNWTSAGNSSGNTGIATAMKCQ